MKYPVVEKLANALDADDDGQAITNAMLAKISLRFSASPNTIIGDGEQTTNLSFIMARDSKEDIAVTTVTFDARYGADENLISPEVKMGKFESGKVLNKSGAHNGNQTPVFEHNNHSITVKSADGLLYEGGGNEKDERAVATLTSGNLTGYISPQIVRVTAKAKLRVDDVERTLEDYVDMYFNPYTISGTLKKGDGSLRKNTLIKIDMVLERSDNLEVSRQGDIEDANVEDPAAKGYYFKKLGGSKTEGEIKAMIDAGKIKLYDEDKGYYRFIYRGFSGEDGSYSVFVPFAGSDFTYEMGVRIPKDESPTGTALDFYQDAPTTSSASGGSDNVAAKTLAGIIAKKKPDGSAAVFSNEELKKLTVEYKEIDDDGNISEDAQAIKPNLDAKGAYKEKSGVRKGKTYYKEVYYSWDHDNDDTSPAEKVLIARQKVVVNSDGDMVIDEELIDPYGTVVDANTNAPISGVKLSLYVKKSDGSFELVKLPASTLALSNNANPQTTTVLGKYAWMVFPNKEYYITAEKPGYYSYDSRTDGGYKDDSKTLSKGLIKVELAIVKWDFKMKPIENNSSSSGGIAPRSTDDKPKGGDTRPYDKNDDELKNEISTDKNKNYVGEEFNVKVDYKNDSKTDIDKAWLKIVIPDGVRVSDVKDGVLLDGNVYFKIKDLSSGESGNVDFEVVGEDAMPMGSLYEFESVILSFDEKDDLSFKSHAFVKVFPLDSEMLFPSYIYGRPDGGFHPDNYVSRAEIAAILVRNSKSKADIGTPKKFNDVKAEDWFYAEVESASALGYFEGEKNGDFRPNDAITREELAIVVARYFGISSAEESQISNPFSDIEHSFAKKDIQLIARNKMINGYPDGTFKPKGKMIRSETVKLFNDLLYRYPTPDVSASFNDVDKSHWAYGDVESSFRGFAVKKTKEGLKLRGLDKINPYYKN